MKKPKSIVLGIAGIAFIIAVSFSVIKYQLPKSTAPKKETALIATAVIPTTTTSTVATTSALSASTTPNGALKDTSLATLAATTSVPKAPHSAQVATSEDSNSAASTSNSTTPQTTAAPEYRAPITAPLDDQKDLANETVAIVCVKPTTAGSVGELYFGTGEIVNKNGYILTNEHVIQDSTECFMGRSHVIPQGFQGDGPDPTMALYYSLTLIGKGIGVTDPSDQTQVSSFHDFAIFKIDAKMPRSEWQSDDAPLVIRTLSSSYIPWATDAEYAAFSPDGVTFPAITINFNYQPVRGDFLSMGGFIADAAEPRYIFTSGNLAVYSTTTISVAMPTGQGLSGSPIVDNNGEVVALNFAMDCGEWQGCYEWDNPGDIGFSAYTYGNEALALTISFINQAMQEDLGFSLKDLTTMN